MSAPLVAVPLREWRDPESVFVALHGEAPHAFWLDAGPDATTGWSLVGAGTPDDSPRAGLDVGLAVAKSGEAGPAGRFRGGWVGWFGYEGGARSAGAPVAGSRAAEDADVWLRVDR